ncbi:MAG: hypothetical protein SGJ01_14920 [Gemmatimonadota bacterium]|nr:hypothetical protein [Gemmatimonadota bacterium]
MNSAPSLRPMRWSAAVVTAILLGPAQPAWVFEREAGVTIRSVWDASVLAQQERVACLAGTVGPDTVVVAAAGPLEPREADSLTANAEGSLEQCGPPLWIGTIHTHVRSTDDPSPAPHFSGQDRVVMSLWASRWRRPGAFCVAYGPRSAHCEVYPLRSPARE